MNNTCDRLVVYCRLFCIKIVRLTFHVFYIFKQSPNKIVFISYDGKQISCNPFYIYKYLTNEYPQKFDIFWVCNRTNNSCDIAKDRIIHPFTLRYFYHMLTASFVVTNDGLRSFIPFRRSQVIINTWHGGGLVKNFAGNFSESELVYFEKQRKHYNRIEKVYLSTSAAWSSIVCRKLLGFPGIILDSGFPRNDIFFSDASPIVDNLRSLYNVHHNEMIVLYAPTFRGSAKNGILGKLDTTPLDVVSICKVLENKFQKVVKLFLRGHHALRQQFFYDNCIDVTNYPDMQELLVASDVLITDYSSSQWDFSLSLKPCFIYAPDFDSYSETPGFLSDYREWPFPIARNNKELIHNIDSFDIEIYKKKVSHFHKEYGSYEHGNSSEQVVKYIVSVYNSLV